MEQAQLITAAPTQTAEKPKRTKVAILGFVSHWQLAPFNDPEFEIWGLNELYQHIPRWDRWFEIHDRQIYENDRNRVSDHIQKLKAMTCPVYMHKHWDDIPNSVEYPLRAIAQMFPNPCPEAKPYYNNSITYMILLAIAEGFREIHVYGVDMAHDCIAPDMRVLTSDLRWVPAGSLSVGQELLAFDEEVPEVGAGEPARFRKYRRTRVESLSQIKRPCYRLRMADGSVLTASEGHKWLTLGGIQNTRRWLDTSSLQPHSTYPKHAAKIVKLTQVWDEDHSWDAGYLAAAFDGEGHLSQNKRTNCSSTGMVIGFSQRPNAMSTQVQDSLARLGFDCSDGGEPEDGCGKYALRGGRPELIRFLGTVRPPRLLEKFDADKVGCLNSIDDVAVLEREFIGEQEVVGIRTGTQTLIIEGFASHNSEYKDQRPSCEWAIGIAQGRGIKVHIPSESDLLKTLYLYGYEQLASQAWDRKLVAQKADVEKHLANLDAQINQLIEARGQYRGAHQSLDNIIKNWKSEHKPPTTS